MATDKKRIEDLELLIYGDKKKGIRGIATEVADQRRINWMLAGAWAIVGFVLAYIKAQGGVI